jgi:hypothetical protein
MSRKVQRVRYTLDPKEIKELPYEEIAAILRGADELIMQGGRTLLAKILKGSREKTVLELNLDKSPVYGFYHNLTIEQILARIDWVILEGYLALEYSGRLPLLVYTKRGWDIEKETYTDELLQGFNVMLDSGADAFNMLYLKDRDRGMILRLLEKVEASGNAAYIPLLEAWKKIDYKKVRKRIQHVIEYLKQSDLKK